MYKSMEYEHEVWEMRCPLTKKYRQPRQTGLSETNRMQSLSPWLILYIASRIKQWLIYSIVSREESWRAYVSCDTHEERPESRGKSQVGLIRYMRQRDIQHIYTFGESLLS